MSTISQNWFVMVTLCNVYMPKDMQFQLVTRQFLMIMIVCNGKWLA